MSSEKRICGPLDNDDPYLECQLPAGHDGLHSDRADPTPDQPEQNIGNACGVEMASGAHCWQPKGHSEQERCPTCGSDDPGFCRGVGSYAGRGEHPHGEYARTECCPDPFHSTQPVEQGERQIGDWDCLICGAEHPPTAPHQPGEQNPDSDAEKLVAWLREGADELEKAHAYLDEVLEVPRKNPATGNSFTLAARIAFATSALIDKARADLPPPSLHQRIEGLIAEFEELGTSHRRQLVYPRIVSRLRAVLKGET